MLKKFLVLLVTAVMLLSFTQKVEAQLCWPASFYDTIAWNWEYYGPCDPSYNCLGYATGSMTLEWPWGTSEPTSSQVDSYLVQKNYSPYGYEDYIISYGSSGAIKHFSKITGPSTCIAKFGKANLMKHTSWDPYVPSGSYGPKIKVYKKRFIVSIDGPTEARRDEDCLWVVQVSGGYPPYSYEWRSSDDGYPFDTFLGTNDFVDPIMPDRNDLSLQVKVTDSKGTVRYDELVVINLGEGSPGEMRFNKGSINTELSANIAEMRFNLNPQNLSSNPYRHIDNSGFKKIVAMGPKALENIRRAILKSGKNGMIEYLLAIAAEEIAGVDLKKESKLWVNGRGWVMSWQKFLVTLPEKVGSIVDSGLPIKERNGKLEALGFAALPLIEDRIDSGNSSLKTVYNSLISKYENQTSLKRADNQSSRSVTEEFRRLLKK